MVPPVLEHAGQVSVVVDQTVPDLELLKFNVHLFVIDFFYLVQILMK